MKEKETMLTQRENEREKIWKISLIDELINLYTKQSLYTAFPISGPKHT